MKTFIAALFLMVPLLWGTAADVNITAIPAATDAYGTNKLLGIDKNTKSRLFTLSQVAEGSGSVTNGGDATLTSVGVTTLYATNFVGNISGTNNISNGTISTNKMDATAYAAFIGGGDVTAAGNNILSGSNTVTGSLNVIGSGTNTLSGTNIFPGFISKGLATDANGNLVPLSGQTVALGLSSVATNLLLYGGPTLEDALTSYDAVGGVAARISAGGSIYATALYGSFLGDGNNLTNLPGVLNVRDFGAVGDGTTDDRAAIQKAIDRAATNKYPLLRAVRLPAGYVYATAATLYLSNGVTIMGDLSGNAWLDPDGGQYGSAIKFKTGTQTNDRPLIRVGRHCTIKDLAFVGLGSTYAGMGLFLSGAQDDGDNTAGCGTLVRDCHFYMLQDGVRLAGNAVCNDFLGVSFASCSNAVHMAKDNNQLTVQSRWIKSCYYGLLGSTDSSCAYLDWNCDVETAHSAVALLGGAYRAIDIHGGYIEGVTNVFNINQGSAVTIRDVFIFSSDDTTKTNITLTGCGDVGIKYVSFRGMNSPTNWVADSGCSNIVEEACYYRDSRRVINNASSSVIEANGTIRASGVVYNSIQTLCGAENTAITASTAKYLNISGNGVNSANPYFGIPLAKGGTLTNFIFIAGHPVRERT